jgi:hypothetical protein
MKVGELKDMIYQGIDKSDRRSSREMWLREIKRINFEEESFYDEFNEENYSEESFP